MSKKKVTIELEAPEYGDNDEVIKIEGLNCNYCHGTGDVYGGENKDGIFRKRCPMCCGSGKMDALVTVWWKAHQNEE